MDKNVIRYAKVVISKEPKPPEPEEKAEDSEIEENGKKVENNTNLKDDKEGTRSPGKPEEKSKINGSSESDLEDEYISW